MSNDLTPRDVIARTMQEEFGAMGSSVQEHLTDHVLSALRATGHLPNANSDPLDWPVRRYLDMLGAGTSVEFGGDRPWKLRNMAGLDAEERQVMPDAMSVTFDEDSVDDFVERRTREERTHNRMFMWPESTTPTQPIDEPCNATMVTSQGREVRCILSALHDGVHHGPNGNILWNARGPYPGRNHRELLRLPDPFIKRTLGGKVMPNEDKI